MSIVREGTDSPATKRVQPGIEYVGAPLDRKELLESTGPDARTRRWLARQVSKIALAGIVLGGAVSLLCKTPYPFTVAVLILGGICLMRPLAWFFKSANDHEPNH